jgi:integrase
MASKRQRGTGSWEYIVKKKGVLPKPLSLTFHDEVEGDTYVAHLEKLLAKGIVPDEFKEKTKPVTTLSMAIAEYLDAVHVTDEDIQILNSFHMVLKGIDLSRVKYAWAEEWIKELQVSGLSPSSIRKRVGALARCLDWVLRRENTMLDSNPLRVLPKRYSTTANGLKDVERDRRLQEGEESRILAIISKEKPEGRERALALPHADALRLMIVLALETAMRMREIYTLTRDQVDIRQRTIFLDLTKNGSKRQVPMSSVALATLKDYLTVHEGDQIFPFWDGKMTAGALKATTTKVSQQWARIFSAAGCADLRFHDLRHEAVSRLFERTTLGELEIAKISGHSSMKMLMRYANLRGSNLAERLW